MENKKRYYSFNEYLRERFGERVHRLSLNAGFTCPNRDGSLGTTGCIYCNEEGFSQHADTELTLDEQIVSSMQFARERYNAKKFIAYFQNGTGTYAPVDELKKTYDVIKKYPEVVGLSISTRPDCVDEEKLDMIAGYKKDYEVWIEYGVQTFHDRTLNYIARGHSSKESILAIEKTAERGIKAAAHIILGLPGETEEDMIGTAQTLAELPVSGVKFHVLHVMRGTALDGEFRAGRIKLLAMEEYVDIICGMLEILPKKCVILRLVSEARGDVLVAPGWIQEKQMVIKAIEKNLENLDTWQGKRNGYGV